MRRATKGVAARPPVVSERDAVEQDLLNTQIAWLARRIGALHLRVLSAPLHVRELRSIRTRTDRVMMAYLGLEHRRDGARRAWVLGRIAALGRHLRASSDDEEAWTAWLDEMLEEGLPDGPFPDVAAVLVDDAIQSRVIEAARAYVAQLEAPARRGRKPPGSPADTVYAPLRLLLMALPDGKGGVLGSDLSNAALRKVVERARREKL